MIAYNIGVPKISNNTTLVNEINGVWRDLVDTTSSEKYLNANISINYTGIPKVVAIVKIAQIDKTKIFESIYLHKDFYSGNPLSEIAVVKKPKEVELIINIKGRNENDINILAQKDTTEIIGLYHNFNNNIDFVFKHTSGVKYALEQSLSCQTDFLRDFSIETSFDASYTQNNKDFYFSSSMNYNLTIDKPNNEPRAIAAIMYDKWGNVRGIFQKNLGVYAFPIKYKNENALVQLLGNRTLEVYSYSGKLLKKTTIVNDAEIMSMHHDCIHLEGSIYAIPYGIAPKSSTGFHDECGIIELNIESGEVIKKYDLSKTIVTKRVITTDVPAVIDPSDDIIHVKSVVYNHKDNSYIISNRYQVIAKIMRNDGSLRWLITPHIALKAPDNDIDLTSKVLTPTNFSKTEDWPIGQHSATLLPNGDVMCLDNHNEPTVNANQSERYTRVTIFEADEQKMSTTKLWDYHTPDKRFAWYMSSAFMQENKVILSSYSTQQYSNEGNPITNNIVWEAQYQLLNFRGDIYRTYKIDIN